MGNIHDIYFDNLLYYAIANYSEICMQSWSFQPWESLRCTLSSKRNATFLKLPFFWKKVYTSESGAIITKSLRSYVRVNDPGALGKMDRLKLYFF